MTRSDLTALEHLLRSELLRGVSEADLRSIEPPPEMLFLGPGETLIRQGDEGTDYFLLVNGRLRSFAEGQSGRVPVGHVLPGEGVGEMSLLTNEPRASTIIARTPSEVVRFPQRTFLRLAEQHPTVALGIARTVVRRSQTTRPRDRRGERYQTITVVPITAGFDVIALADDLARALGTFGRSEHYDSTLGVELSQGDRLDDALTRMLFDLEQQLDFVVYSIDETTSAWSRHCILCADLIFLVADVDAPVEPGLLESELLTRVDRDLLGRVDLVLVHGAEWRKNCGAANWIASRKPREHHHIRSANAGDVARLARIVSGRANNLVLGGGGARGFAQIGALKAFAEAGVPIDRVGGTSVGSLFAALYARGTSCDDMIRLSREHFIGKRPTREFTFPAMSLVAGRRMQQVAIDLCGDCSIEDLPVRYFCVSADLGRAELVTHFEGKLWAAVRASGSFPVIGPPFFFEGRVLIDGGVLNNLPVDIMRENFSGAVLAVDVSARAPLQVDRRWDSQTPSGWQLLLNRLNPFTPNFDLPSIFEVLHRTASLSGESLLRQTRSQADFLIRPSVARYRIADFEALDTIVEIGYRETIKELEALRGAPDRLAEIEWPSQQGSRDDARHVLDERTSDATAD